MIVQGDALHLPLADESVDLIVTSPPYFALRSYRDDGEHYDGQIGSEPTPQAFLEALWAATREMVRVLKPEGSIWINLGDKYAGSGMGPTGVSSIAPGSGERTPQPDTDAKRLQQGTIRSKSLMGLPWRYAIGCIDNLNLILRAEIIWSKPNGLPESVTDRVRRSHEQWFHFVKEPRYFSAVDEIREPHLTPIHSPGQKRITTDRNDGDRNDRTFGDASLGRLPGSVWTIPTEPLKVPEQFVDHFAAFPQEWPRKLILGWSPSGICVECGEGRRPHARMAGAYAEHRAQEGRYGTQQSARKESSGWSRPVDAPATAYVIDGYVCACPTPDAPIRPAVVLDPFGGTGTVAGVARKLGRIGISLDLSMDYSKLAKWRVFQSGHFDKTLKRTMSDRQQTLL